MALSNIAFLSLVKRNPAPNPLTLIIFGSAMHISIYPSSVSILISSGAAWILKGMGWLIFSLSPLTASPL